MDSVTISSLLAAAAGALGSEGVKDLYAAAIQRIKDLVGQDEDLLEALELVEEKPQSSLRQKTLKEQLGLAEKNRNPLIRVVFCLYNEGCMHRNFTLHSQKHAPGDPMYRKSHVNQLAFEDFVLPFGGNSPVGRMEMSGCEKTTFSASQSRHNL